MTDTRPARRAAMAAFALNGGLFGLWASRIPAFVAEFSLTPDRLGLLLLCIAGGAIVAFPLAGRLTDRIGAAALVRRLIPAQAVTLVLVALAPDIATLALALALFGASYGALDVAMNSWGAEIEQARSRPLMSSLHALYSLGTGLGAASGAGAVALGLAPPAHFAALALVCGLPTFLLARTRWASRQSDRPAAIFALPRGPLLLIGVVALASAVGEGAMADWSAVFLVSAAGTTEAQAALGFAAFSAAMVATRLAGDAIIARAGPVAVARASGLAAAAGVAVLVAAPGLGWALPGFALMGVGYAMIFPLAFSRAARDPDVPPGQAIAGVATLGYGGMLLGPPLIGWVAALTSLGAAFGLIGALALVITALAPSLR